MKVFFSSEDECASETHDCHENAFCTDLANKFSCECNQGYAGDGKFCDDINECNDAEICGQKSVCQNTVGTYQCECISGYQLEGDQCKGMHNFFFQIFQFISLTISQILMLFVKKYTAKQKVI